jgi:signal-transduction protein with cAMP-binding, CBS, and nucleotidyltransferase domain
MKLQEIMKADVIQISPGEPIGEAAKRMREKSVGCLVVTFDGVIKGIITDRDLLACISQSHDPYHCAVARHMSRPAIVLPPEEDHLTAAQVMSRERIKRLPITKDGKLLGIVSLSDLAAFAEHELGRLASSTLFISHLIRTQGAQRGPSKIGAVTESGVAETARERAVMH